MATYSNSLIAFILGRSFGLHQRGHNSRRFSVTVVVSFVSQSSHLRRLGSASVSNPLHVGVPAGVAAQALEPDSGDETRLDGRTFGSTIDGKGLQWRSE